MTQIHIQWRNTNMKKLFAILMALCLLVSGAALAEAA